MAKKAAQGGGGGGGKGGGGGGKGGKGGGGGGKGNKEKDGMKMQLLGDSKKEGKGDGDGKQADPVMLTDEEADERRMAQGPENKVLFPLWWMFSQNKYAEKDLCFCFKITNKNRDSIVLTMWWLNSACRVFFFLCIVTVVPLLLNSPTFTSAEY